MLLCAAWQYGKSGCYCVQRGSMINQDVIVCSVAVWEIRMLLCAAWQYEKSGCYCVQRGSMR